MREIKYQGIDEKTGELVQLDTICLDDDYQYKHHPNDGLIKCKTETLKQYTGLKDKNGKEIYESDVLRFADKWEWYRASGASKEEIDKLPYEERVISIPEDYEWLLSSEIQTYWEVAGNIYESPELLEETK